MLIINNRSLKISNSWLNPVSSPEPPPPTPTFDEVTIGTQIWMSSNLDIDDGGDGIYELNDVKWYSLSAAQRIANTISGWHLPTMSEWETLQTYIGGWDAGTSLGSITGWTVLNGTNTTGFNAYPNGIYSLINGTVILPLPAPRRARSPASRPKRQRRPGCLHSRGS